MIARIVRCAIGPDRLEADEAHARFWRHKIPEPGGTHHGYFLPIEGPTDIADGHVSVPSRAASGASRAAMRADRAHAHAHAGPTGCIRRYDRPITRPLLAGAGADGLGL